MCLMCISSNRFLGISSRPPNKDAGGKGVVAAIRIWTENEKLSHSEKTKGKSLTINV